MNSVFWHSSIIARIKLKKILNNNNFSGGLEEITHHVHRKELGTHDPVCQFTSCPSLDNFWYMLITVYWNTPQDLLFWRCPEPVFIKLMTHKPEKKGVENVIKIVSPFLQANWFNLEGSRVTICLYVHKAIKHRCLRNCIQVIKILLLGISPLWVSKGRLSAHGLATVIMGASGVTRHQSSNAEQCLERQSL